MTHSEQAASFAALSPVCFLQRAGRFFAGRPAIIDGDRQLTYGQVYSRVLRLSASLKSLGVAAGDRVALLSPNAPAMLEAHFAVPMAGAVINPLNLSFDAAALAYCLQHAEPRCVICDQAFLPHLTKALSLAACSPAVVVVLNNGSDADVGDDMSTYEELLKNADDPLDDAVDIDEYDPLSLLYTSGTTAKPKAVTYLHRGAYLAALSNALSVGLNHNSIFLWTWPMFHSHGLSFVWAVTAVGGTHVCLREFEPARVYELIEQHKVTHFCVAPTVLNALADSPAAATYAADRSPEQHPSVQCIIGGAAPASATISRFEKLGIEVVHQYGSTECYGPVTLCWRRHDWQSMTIDERHAMLAKQGSPTPGVTDFRVVDPDTDEPIPADGVAIGEIQLRGNTVMHGYYKDAAATESAMRGGWYHTGDIASCHPDGFIEIKDRSVDLIISGGERISSVEIDEVLYRHPDVLEAAVVAKPDDALGEVPYAFVAPREGTEIDADALRNFCAECLPAHKVPRAFVTRDLPKTATGKIKKLELRELAARL